MKKLMIAAVAIAACLTACTKKEAPVKETVLSTDTTLVSTTTDTTVIDTTVDTTKVVDSAKVDSTVSK